MRRKSCLDFINNVRVSGVKAKGQIPTTQLMVATMKWMREGCLFKVEGYGRFEWTLLPLKACIAKIDITVGYQQLGHCFAE